MARFHWLELIFMVRSAYSNWMLFWPFQFRVRTSYLSFLVERGYLRFEHKILPATRSCWSFNMCRGMNWDAKENKHLTWAWLGAGKNLVIGADLTKNIFKKFVRRTSWTWLLHTGVRGRACMAWDLLSASTNILANCLQICSIFELLSKKQKKQVSMVCLIVRHMLWSLQFIAVRL